MLSSSPRRLFFVFCCHWRAFQRIVGCSCREARHNNLSQLFTYLPLLSWWCLHTGARVRQTVYNTTDTWPTTPGRPGRPGEVVVVCFALSDAAPLWVCARRYPTSSYQGQIKSSIVCVMYPAVVSVLLQYNSQGKDVSSPKIRPVTENSSIIIRSAV